MTSPFKGAIQQAMRNAAQGRGSPKGPIGRAMQGALSRLPRKAPPPPKPPVDPGELIRKGNHGFRNAGPIKPSITAEADATMAQTGEGLRKTIGKIAGRVIRRKEGGKVGSAMSALQSLAKRYQAALDSGDEVLARRLKREMELKKGKPPEKESESTKKGREDKLATFARGGKVGKIRGVTLGILKKHPRWNKDDYHDLLHDGYTKEKIKEFWDKDLKKNPDRKPGIPDGVDDREVPDDT